MSVTTQSKLHSAQGGFTLIELIVYMAISTILIVVITSFMVDVTKISVIAKTRKEVKLR